MLHQCTATEQEQSSLNDDILGEDEEDPTFVEEYAYDPVAPPGSSDSTSPGAAGTTRAESYEITCPSLPSVEGVYKLKHIGQYNAVEGPNVIIKHPVDGVWCVTNGEFFIAMAMREALLPDAVREWKCLVGGRRMVKSDDMSVVRIW